MRIYGDNTTPCNCVPVPLDPEREALLVKLGAGPHPHRHDPDIQRVLDQVGPASPLPDDPIPPLPEIPPAAIAALVVRLGRRAPKATFPPMPPEGVSIKWHRSGRWVPAAAPLGEAREPKPALRLKQQGQHGSRERQRRKAVRQQS